MTMRDYFAAKAMQGFAADSNYGATLDVMAELSYRWADAMLRHLMREATGEERDPDSGLHHAAHAAWNALARLDLALRKASNVELTGSGRVYRPESSEQSERG